MAILRPVKLVIDNYPDDKTEWLDAVNNPEDASAGKREIPFSKYLYIEQDDFRESPPPKYYRLFPGNEVRLRYAYLITCTSVRYDSETGGIAEIHCVYDPKTRGGDPPDGRKIKSTIHWVSAPHSKSVEIRLYDQLFSVENPDLGEDIHSIINPNSLEVLHSSCVEPSLVTAKAGERFQFERNGYFCVDPDSDQNTLVFNRTVTLRDSWAKQNK
jgi:glutaminyl-tRNA synthetase